ncbi:50S ribosomal protein L23 [Candidatus Gracilibacteria bacterium]|nr:50S ribosomal protein L23 [Candidatus Gracilibacteria bacterium]MCF7819090.1 50S ribosomal protein L23 [Candidatus Gracilibacteria bacterium]
MAAKNQYTFVIHSQAQKSDVRQALKEFYGVEPLTIMTSTLPPKYRVAGRGRPMRKRAPLKKAIITLPSGTELDFNAFK